MEHLIRSTRYSTSTEGFTEKLSNARMFSITNLLTDRLIGHLIDLSQDGFKMSTWKQIEIETIYNLRLSMPEDVYGNSYIVFAAECVWCEKQGSSNSYVAGFRLWSVTPENSQRIKQLIGLLKSTGGGQTGSG